jgi:hypothetical protein
MRLSLVEQNLHTVTQVKNKEDYILTKSKHYHQNK